MLVRKDAANLSRQDAYQTFIGYDAFWTTIEPMLSTRDRANVGQTCKFAYARTKQKLLMSKLQHKIEIFLQHIMRGQPKEALQMIVEMPLLLKWRGDFDDHANRHFFNTTAFEYLLWAGDYNFYNRIIHLVANSKILSLELGTVLLEQYTRVMTEGVSYTIEGVVHTENHYDMGYLIQLMRNYMDGYDGEEVVEADRINYWCDEVATEQLNVPYHIAQRMCNPLSYFDIGQVNFITEKFKRTTQVRHHEDPTKTLDWFADRSSSENKFGVCRSYRGIIQTQFLFYSRREVKRERMAWACKAPLPEQVELDRIMFIGLNTAMRNASADLANRFQYKEDQKTLGCGIS